MNALTIKRSLFTLGGMIFEGVIIFFGIEVSGGGHYNRPFVIAISPWIVGIIIWPVVGYLSADLSSSFIKIIFVLFLMANYVGIFLYLRAETDSASYWYNLGARDSGWLATVNGIYCFYGIGQLFLWGRFFYFVFKKSPTISNEG